MCITVHCCALLCMTLPIETTFDTWNVLKRCFWFFPSENRCSYVLGFFEKPQNQHIEVQNVTRDNSRMVKKTILGLSTNMDPYVFHRLGRSGISPCCCGIAKLGIWPKSSLLSSFGALFQVGEAGVKSWHTRSSQPTRNTSFHMDT